MAHIIGHDLTCNKKKRKALENYGQYFTCMCLNDSLVICTAKGHRQF